MFSFVYYIYKGAIYLNKNRVFLIIVNICILFALIGDYLRILLFGKGADIVFDILVMFCIGVFIFELFVNLLVQRGYFLSFYFFLDLITIVTMFFDIVLIANKVFYDDFSYSTV